MHNPRVVADISCGMGYGAVELSNIAGTVIGVDGSPDLDEPGRREVQQAQHPFSPERPGRGESVFAYQRGRRRCVVSFETLEHLNDPNQAVEQFQRLLRPGGFFICSVPNVLSESGDSAGLPRNKSHKQWFNFGSLSRLVQRNDMRVIYRLGQSWSKTLFRREQQLSNAKRLPRRLSDEPVMHAPEMIRWLSYVAAYPNVEDVDGSYSIIIVAQKNDVSK